MIKKDLRKEKKKRKYTKSKDQNKQQKKMTLQDDQPMGELYDHPNNLSSDQLKSKKTLNLALNEKKMLRYHWNRKRKITDVDGDEGEEEMIPPVKKKPPPLIRQNRSSPCHVRPKKKTCPDCSTSITSKCKKCPSCGKMFGVFTFGRKLCSECGHNNSSSKTQCFHCARLLMNAPKTVPEIYHSKCL